MVFIVLTGVGGKNISVNTDTVTTVSLFPKEEMLKEKQDGIVRAFSEKSESGMADSAVVASNLKIFEDAWAPIRSSVKFTNDSVLYMEETPEEIAKIANETIRSLQSPEAQNKNTMRPITPAPYC